MAEHTTPSPELVVPGVWSLPVPFPNPLGYTCCYLVEGGDGAILIDAGWDSERSWTALLAGMRAAGISLGDLVGVVVTHIHPDHYGLAVRLRQHTSAWIGMHPLEAKRIPASASEADAAIDEIMDWLQIVGAPDDDLDELRRDVAGIRAKMSMVRPEVLLTDGQQVPQAGSLTAIHTPGHTPGHLCFLDEVRKIVFTGDHLLPRVTPNVSQRPQMGEDPLGHYLRSIAKIRGLGAVLGLPGHEWAIRDVDARIDQLAAHHEARLAEVESAVRAGASTVWEVSREITWSRPWTSLRGLQRRTAIGETHAHLERLARERRVEYRPGRPARWLPVPVGSGREAARRRSGARCHALFW